MTPQIAALLAVVIPLLFVGIIQILQSRAATRATELAAKQAREDALEAAKLAREEAKIVAEAAKAAADSNTAAIAAASKKAEEAAAQAARSADDATQAIDKTAKTVDIIHTLTNATLTAVTKERDEALLENRLLREQMLSESKAREAPRAPDAPQGVQAVRVTNESDDPVNVKQRPEQ